MTKKIDKVNDDEQEKAEPIEGEKVKEQIDLESELEQAKAQAAEYLDGWQRAQAEFVNYKKRQEIERAQMRERVTGDVLRKVLPAVDDFERATETIPDDIKQLTWSEGISLIKTKLNTILASEGITPIETEGESFDPHYHEAVTYEEAEGYKEGQVIGEVQRGYMLGERVLRAALVRVAKDSTPPSKGRDDTKEENPDKGK